ncbi:MAG TPA: response regulator [Ktedonobacteraceae bacterium]|nr:response regulator [Ktedonobacteraceae bacterium]
MNIAILEDNPSNLEYIRTLLQFEGHRVFAYRDAASFLASIWATYHQDAVLPYDLAIIDLMLPGRLTGLDVLHSLRASDSPLAHFPLIMVSGASQHILDEVQTHFPSVPVLRKPFRMQELISLLATISSKKEIEGSM